MFTLLPAFENTPTTAQKHNISRLI